MADLLYRYCLECEAEYPTSDSLIVAFHVESGEEITAEDDDPDPERINFCPRCMHDW